MRLSNNEKSQKDGDTLELNELKNDPKGFINKKMNEVNNKLIEKDKELKNLNEILKVKESNIRKISVAHTQFKQQLETVREELLYNQNEKENLSRKLTTIEK